MKVDRVPDVLEPLERLGRRPAHETVDLVALLEQEVGEMAAVLPGDAGDERAAAEKDRTEAEELIRD